MRREAWSLFALPLEQAWRARVSLTPLELLGFITAGVFAGTAVAIVAAAIGG